MLGDIFLKVCFDIIICKMIIDKNLLYILILKWYLDWKFLKEINFVKIL